MNDRADPTPPDRGPEPTQVDVHIDLMCPFAYQTSRWLRDVRDQTGLTIDWRFFSLEEVNRAPGKKHPWEREWSYGWSMMHIGVALRRLGSQAQEIVTVEEAIRILAEEATPPDLKRG